jgi:hypothetical protein
MENRELNLYPELAAVDEVNRSQLIRTCPSDGRARRSLMFTVHYGKKGGKVYKVKGTGVKLHSKTSVRSWLHQHGLAIFDEFDKINVTGGFNGNYAVLNDREANLEDEQKPCPPIAEKTFEDRSESQGDSAVINALDDEEPAPTKLQLLIERAQRHCRLMAGVLAINDSDVPLSIKECDLLRQDCIETAEDMMSIMSAHEQREEQTSPVRTPPLSVTRCFLLCT